jgi:hypothetical protein
VIGAALRNQQGDQHAMHYTLLGNSGLRVSEVALGTMTFGTDWGWGRWQAEAPGSSSCSPRPTVPSVIVVTLR